jgi:uncharacterized RDD family membrane protein YckC
MTGVPPEGSGWGAEPSEGQPGQPGPWGSQPGGEPPGGWAATGATPPRYGRAPYGQDLPSYSQFGGQQASQGPGPDWVGQLASWASRAGGYIIDAAVIGIPTAVLYVIGTASKASWPDVLGALWALVMWAWFAVQSGQYGSSPGMRVMGLKLLKASTGTTIGGGMGLVRQLLHVVAWALCGLLYIADMLWPLWDGQRQTLADKVVGTVVIRVPPEPFRLTPRAQ